MDTKKVQQQINSVMVMILWVEQTLQAYLVLFLVSLQALRERVALESVRRQLLGDGSSVLVGYTEQQQQLPIVQ